MWSIQEALAAINGLKVHIAEEKRLEDLFIAQEEGRLQRGNREKDCKAVAKWGEDDGEITEEEKE